MSENSFINPDYYKNGIEVYRFIESHNLNYAEGNIIKYIVRHKYKNGLEDLKKARRYLDFLEEQYDQNK